MRLVEKSGITSLIAILFLLSFKSNAQLLEVKLAPKEPSPYEGVLVPFPQYRWYQEQVEVNQKEELKPIHDNCYGPLAMVALGAVSIWLGFYTGSSIPKNHR